MSGFLKIGVPFVLILAGNMPAFSAEHRFMVPEADTLELILLRQKSVRDELKINDEVAEHIKKYATQQWKKAEEVGSLSEKDQEMKFSEMARENQQFLMKNLTKPQRDRLEQIALQVAGLVYVTRMDIADKLKLTADQKQKAHQLQKAARDELEKVIDSKDAKNRHKEIVAMWQINHDRLEKLLTESQKTTWKQMTGPEFKGEFTYASKQTAAD